MKRKQRNFNTLDAKQKLRLVNLISNHIKFLEKNQITLEQKEFHQIAADNSVLIKEYTELCNIIVNILK